MTWKVFFWNHSIFISILYFSKVFGCWEYNNKYDLISQSGDILLNAKEQSECCERMCCANGRSFTMPFANPQVSSSKNENIITRIIYIMALCNKIISNASLSSQSGEEVLRFERPLKLCSCCCMCCYPSHMQVFI